MRNPKFRIVASRLVAGAIVAAATSALAQSAAIKKPKAQVELLSSVEAVAAGEVFDVAVRFQLADDWHIYWENSGDSGLPPSVTWNLPQGFEASQLQFPIPKRHVSPGDIVTNILVGEPALLARITPPGTIGDQKVVLAADVQYLICSKNCLREEAKVELELPIVARGGEVKPANERLFKSAQRALPKSTSTYLEVKASTKPETLSPGEKFELILNVDIKRGFHIQSHEPLNPAFIKCDVFLSPAPGVSYGEAVYPPPKFRTLKYVGKVSEYAGRIAIQIPGQVKADASELPGRLAGVLRYQACNEKGTCFPPDGLTFAYEPPGGKRAAADPANERRGESGAAQASAQELQGGGDSPSVSDQAESVDQRSALSAEAAGWSYAASPTGDATEGVGTESEPVGALLGRLGIVGLLIGCFLYGLVINATPCVLPLLSIKVLGFVQQAHESRRRTLVLGLAFGAGVMILFVVLGFLAGAGKNILQYPTAVIALGAVVMALGLSMLGVYTLQPPTAATKLEANIRQESLLASFGKGALAPVLGLACTAPFMAGMFALATQQAPRIAFLAFLVTGLGMASPYMLLGAFPHWLSFLPKPGQWMITFERIMGFLLLGMVVWLLHPLVSQIGPVGLEWTLIFLVAVAAGCWVWGKVDFNMSTARRWAYRGGAVGFVVLAGGIIYQVIYPLNEAQAQASRSASATNSNGVNGWSDIPWQLCFVDTAKGALNADGTCEQADDAFCRMCQAIWDAAWESGIPWQRWSRQAVEDAVRSGRTVFVDFTAAYCTQCKVNKYTATNTPEVREKMQELQVIPFQGDYTSGDEEIYSLLVEFNRPGVPLNLIYSGGKLDDPVVLPTELSKSILLDKLDEAGALQTRSASRLSP